MTYPTAQHAEHSGDHPAIIDDREVITYRNLEHRVCRAIGHLRDLGVRPMDRCAVLAENSVEWIILAHAVPRIGAIIAPLHTRWSREEIARWLDLVSPTVVFVGSDTPQGASLSDIWRNRVYPLNDHLWANGTNARPSSLNAPEIDGDQVHWVLPTSGSSGPPKGVCLSFRDFLANAFGSAINLGILPHDRWLLNLPLCHVGGLAIVYRAAIYGTTVVLDGPSDAEATLRLMQDRQVTQLSLVPTTLSRLVDAIGSSRAPASLRTALIGGGPVEVDLLRVARRAGIPALPTYGLTETASQVATFSPNDPDEQLHTVGRPLALCEITIRRDDGTVADRDEIGRICVKGPMVASGYWIEPGRIAPLTSGSWFDTGDLGALDDDGCLTVHGRRDDAIISGGEKVFPEEVERTLELYPGIRRAAVVGIDDSEWGQRNVALIEPTLGAAIDIPTIKAHLHERLAAYKVPRDMVIVTAIPITGLGKIDRTKLVTLYGSTVNAGEKSSEDITSAR